MAQELARLIADKVTDEMLTKPMDELTDVEAEILRAALKGPFGPELIERMVALADELAV